MANNLGVNPWLSMWTKPKATIRKIVDFNPNHRLFVLCAMYGFVSLSSMIQSFAIGQVMNFFLLLLLAIVLSPLWGFIIFSISSAFVLVAGRWIRGEAKYQEVRSAIAWSNVPMIGNIILWVILLIMFGSNIFKDFHQAFVLSGMERSFLFLILFAQLVLSIWVLVLYINSLAEVQRFSVGKAILNLIIAVAVFVSLFFIITICYFLILKGLHSI